jgi:predicted amidophosphoribosyltransferase
LPRLSDPCHWCGAPRRGPDAACRACGGQGLTHLQRVLVAHPYRGLVEELVGDAKAGSRPAAARVLAQLLPELPADAPGRPTVVPVPPSPGRRPGPHLGSIFARAVARRDALPLKRLLSITRLAAEQHRLGAPQRRENVAGLFACRGRAPDYVLLVDDLVTSGATASSAAEALRAAGAKRVDLLCLARTPRLGEELGAGGDRPTVPKAGSS